MFGLIKFVFKRPSFKLDELVDDIVNLGEAYRKDRKSLAGQLGAWQNFGGLAERLEMLK